MARDVLQQEGVAGFSMERIAEEAGYSRTAVYHYFPSKEDVIMALAIETTELRLQLQDRVRHFDARPRERMVALGEVTAVLYPVHVVAEVIAYANAVRIKTSDELQQHLRNLDQQEDAVAAEVIAEAVQCGDLSLPQGIRLHELRYALDTFGRGIFSSIATATPFEELDIPDPRVLLRKVGVHFLDGLQWQPLSTEWDYSRTMRRIYSEVFPPAFLFSLGLASDQPRVRKSSARGAVPAEETADTSS